MSAVTGRVFDIQRFSIHDGPGIRTVVFLKGCPMHCLWCHNPESISINPLLAFAPEKCIGCGTCLKVCPRQVHQFANDQHILNRDQCNACGSCAEGCPAKALELVGREMTVSEVLEKVLRDKPFYETSGGGITLSGGEPMMQINFTTELLKTAKMQDLHCCVETCGLTKFAYFRQILPYVDLFLYDIKEMDNDLHIDFTGVPNCLILENLRRLHDNGASVRLRLPLVPGYNDREDHFTKVAELANGLPRLEGVELKPYHPLGNSKISRFGLSQEKRINCKPPDQKSVVRWINHLQIETNLRITTL